MSISTCCPTCGQLLADTPHRFDEVSRVFTANGAAVRFTPKESDIFGAIWRARNRGGVDGLSRLRDLAYANDIDGGSECASTVSVVLGRIREKLRPTGYTVTMARGNPKENYKIIKASATA